MSSSNGKCNTPDDLQRAISNLERTLIEEDLETNRPIQVIVEQTGAYPKAPTSSLPPASGGFSRRKAAALGAGIGTGVWACYEAWRLLSDMLR